MVKQLDNVIQRLIHEADTIKNVVDIEYKNMYKFDKDFKYFIDKKRKEVIITYKTVKFGVLLPVIKVELSPVINYLIFWKKNYSHFMIDTFKLDYTLAMYYIIALQTYYKNNLQIN